MGEVISHAVSRRIFGGERAVYQALYPAGGGDLLLGRVRPQLWSAAKRGGGFSCISCGVWQDGAGHHPECGSQSGLCLGALVGCRSGQAILCVRKVP